MQEHDRALALALEPAFLHGRAELWLAAGDPVRDVHDLHRALHIRPQSPRMLEDHSQALFEVAKRAPRARRMAIISRGIDQLRWLQAISPTYRNVAQKSALLAVVSRAVPARCAWLRAVRGGRTGEPLPVA